MRILHWQRMSAMRIADAESDNTDGRQLWAGPVTDRLPVLLTKSHFVAGAIKYGARKLGRLSGMLRVVTVFRVNKLLIGEDHRQNRTRLVPMRQHRCFRGSFPIDDLSRQLTLFRKPCTLIQVQHRRVYHAVFCAHSDRIPHGFTSAKQSTETRLVEQK